jgi:hypothetical protein
MKNPNNKYVKLLNWVDHLPDGEEFTFVEAEEATGIPNSSLQGILSPLCKNGIMCRREANCQILFYSKGPAWSLEKALEANYARLQAKWQRYKPKK